MERAEPTAGQPEETSPPEENGQTGENDRPTENGQSGENGQPEQSGDGEGDPSGQDSAQETEAPPEETQPEETQAEETQAEETNPPETQAQASVPDTYQVKQGDTLQKISISVYGNEDMIHEICEKNEITNPDFLFAGQVLVLP